MLAACRLLLGMGEGGGFPAATRVTAEWFPPERACHRQRNSNAGSAVGSAAAPPLIALILERAPARLHLAAWRWVFFISGRGVGIFWCLFWWRTYFTPESPRGAEVRRPPPPRSRWPAPCSPAAKIGGWAWPSS